MGSGAHFCHAMQEDVGLMEKIENERLHFLQYFFNEFMRWNVPKHQEKSGDWQNYMGER